MDIITLKQEILRMEYEIDKLNAELKQLQETVYETDED